MKQLVLFALLVGNSLFSQGQQWANRSRQPDFQKFYLLLTKWQQSRFTTADGQLMTQRFWIDGRKGILLHEWHPVLDTAGRRNWFYQMQIPLYTLDSITQKQFDGMLFFHATKVPMVSAKFDTIQQQYIPQSPQAHYTIFMRTGEVRNLPWQLFSCLNGARASYQKSMPKSATDLIDAAVYSYFARRGYLREIVSLIGADNKLFVGKCAICNGTKAACARYVKDFAHAAFSPQDSLMDGFQAANTEERLRRLERIVEQAVQLYYYDYPGFTDTDVQYWETELADQRKRSMRIAPGRKCASCDGACKPKKSTL